MKSRKLSIKDSEYPSLLKEIPGAPKNLYVIGASLGVLTKQPIVAVVGSRKVSPYGRQTTRKLTNELASMGIVIVSGLALGVDSIAHEAALEAKGKTIAVLPCGLDAIYPAGHTELARRILLNGGALITEYNEGTTPFPANFVARNRIVSGISSGVLITEAADKSGSLHTANYALEQGREVMAVPGNITSPTSVGTNKLIKTGATPVTQVDDILNALKITLENKTRKAEILADSAAEFTILSLMEEGTSDSDELLKQSELEAAIFSQTLTLLEIKGVVKPGGGKWFRV